MSKTRISRLIESNQARYITNHGVPYTTCPSCDTSFLPTITCSKTDEGRLCPICTASKRHSEISPLEAWRNAIDLLAEGKRFIIV